MHVIKFVPKLPVIALRVCRPLFLSCSPLFFASNRCCDFPRLFWGLNSPHKFFYWWLMMKLYTDWFDCKIGWKLVIINTLISITNQCMAGRKITVRFIGNIIAHRFISFASVVTWFFNAHYPPAVLTTILQVGQISASIYETVFIFLQQTEISFSRTSSALAGHIICGITAKARPKVV